MKRLLIIIFAINQVSCKKTPESPRREDRYYIISSTDDFQIGSYERDVDPNGGPIIRKGGQSFKLYPQKEKEEFVIGSPHNLCGEEPIKINMKIVTKNYNFRKDSLLLDSFISIYYLETLK